MKPKKIGRPRAERKREIRLRWTLPVADCLEEYRGWIEKNWKQIVKMAKGERNE